MRLTQRLLRLDQEAEARFQRWQQQAARRPAPRPGRDVVSDWSARESPAVHGLRSLVADTLANHLRRPRPSIANWPRWVLGPLIVGVGLVGRGLWGLVRFTSVAPSLGELAIGIPLLTWFVLYVMRPEGPPWWADDD